MAAGNPANVSAIPRKDEGAEKPQRTSETSTKSVQPQVSTNTRAGWFGQIRRAGCPFDVFEKSLIGWIRDKGRLIAIVEKQTA